MKRPALRVTLTLDTQDLKELAELALDADDYHLAHRLLTHLSTLLPDDADILDALSFCLLKLDRWQDAHNILHQVATLDTTGRADIHLAWAPIRHDPSIMHAIQRAQAVLAPRRDNA